MLRHVDVGSWGGGASCGGGDCIRRRGAVMIDWVIDDSVDFGEESVGLGDRLIGALGSSWDELFGFRRQV